MLSVQVMIYLFIVLVIQFVATYFVFLLKQFSVTCYFSFSLFVLILGQGRVQQHLVGASHNEPTVTVLCWVQSSLQLQCSKCI